MSFKPNVALKGLLFSRRMTQRELAFNTQINEDTLSSIIRGYQRPTEETKAKIAKELGVTIEDVFPL